MSSLLASGSRRMRRAWLKAVSCCACDQGNNAKTPTTPSGRRQRIVMVPTRRRANHRLCRRAGRSGTASMNDELANSLGRFAGLNAELANSIGCSAGSDSQVKTWVCGKAGRLGLMVHCEKQPVTRAPRDLGDSASNVVGIVTDAEVSRRADTSAACGSLEWLASGRSRRIPTQTLSRYREGDRVSSGSLSPSARAASERLEKPRGPCADRSMRSPSGRVRAARPSSRPSRRR